MNLQSIMQSELSQKEKNKYAILMHIYGIQKDGTDEPIFRTTMDTQTERADLWTQGGREGQIEGLTLKYIHQSMQNIQPVEICCMIQGSQTWCCVHLDG